MVAQVQVEPGAVCSPFHREPLVSTAQVAKPPVVPPPTLTGWTAGVPWKPRRPY
jgi:hypothetical protein